MKNNLNKINSIALGWNSFLAGYCSSLLIARILYEVEKATVKEKMT